MKTLAIYVLSSAFALAGPLACMHGNSGQASATGGGPSASAPASGGEPCPAQGSSGMSGSSSTPESGTMQNEMDSSGARGGGPSSGSGQPAPSTTTQHPGHTGAGGMSGY